MERISPAFSNFSLGFNTSLLKTKVNVSPKYETQDEDGNITSTATIETFKDTRELQGASKFLVNSDLKYQFKLSKTTNTISLVYALFSKRIYAIGTNNADHAYELPFQQLDLVWSSKLSNHFDVKFSADNLLNPSREIEFGNNGTVPINQNSFTQSSYKKGVGFSMNLSYTF